MPLAVGDECEATTLAPSGTTPEGPRPTRLEPRFSSASTPGGHGALPAVSAVWETERIAPTVLTDAHLASGHA